MIQIVLKLSYSFSRICTSWIPSNCLVSKKFIRNFVQISVSEPRKFLRVNRRNFTKLAETSAKLAETTAETSASWSGFLDTAQKTGWWVSDLQKPKI